ncbi:four-carbon acid sugar kinase family protein [Azospirillum sp. ST 5-10]|uniref:four-carbon acid sugar kinase family protein n=1 Tax=unclassified Azospirillum TaxID=2630922 RepID=UPI003F49E3BD
MAQILVLTDTLAGAVDAALAFTGTGVPTGLLLSPRADRPETSAVVVDLDTGRLAPAAAGLLASEAVQRLRSTGTTLVRFVGPEPGAATAAEAAAIRDTAARNGAGRPLLLAAPAWPERGTPVPTAVWRRALQEAGLRVATLEAETAGAGADAVRRRLAVAAADADAVVCGAADDAALATLAHGAALCGASAVWLGGTGLVRHLPAALGLAVPGAVLPALPTPADPVLAVMGVAAGAAPGHRLEVPGPVLRLGPGSAEWGHAEQALREALSGGVDVVLAAAPRGAGEEAGDEHARAVALGRFVRDQLPRAGALVLSGGDTARAVLLAGAMGSLRVLGAAPPGGLVCLTEGRRVLPVVLVPGAAAGPDALARWRVRLRTAAAPPVAEAGRGLADAG